MTKKKEVSEIKWNIINSALAGALVLLGSLSTGELTPNSFLLAVIAGGTVAITKFKNYWEGSNKKGQCKLFSFL